MHDALIRDIEIETVRLPSNEGNNMKGARQRVPVRPRRNVHLTLLASAVYAVFTVRSAIAQTAETGRSSPGFGHSDLLFPPVVVASPEPASSPSRRHFDGRFMRAQHHTGKTQNDPHQPAQVMPTMQPIPPVDPAPPARPPRHEVMTPDERRLLRQHIEEAVRDLYKR
jgi:hypothetical protein